MDEGTTAIPVKPNERVEYHCCRCGACCRHIRGSVMLEPLDVYRLAKHLQEKMGVIDGVHSLHSLYAEGKYLSGTHFPIYTLKTLGPDDACVFLKNNACAVYMNRPRVCRIYPFTVEPGERGRNFLYSICVDDHAHHLQGGHVTVKDWVYENFSREEKEFLLEEWANTQRFAEIFKKRRQAFSSPQVTQISFYRYFAYDLNEPFMPQYRLNHANLFKKLEEGAED